ncbi:MAG: hypothetical protein QNJ98_19905 [Planctomycetota bacterium]|nr:hypothetical protein [Planctomycetota bacterium]
MGDQQQADFELRVVEVLQETPVDRTIRFEVVGADPSAFRFEPGQYVCVWDPEDPETKRYFSISGGEPAAHTFQVTIRTNPDKEPAFYSVPVGQTILTQPPAGAFVLSYEPGDQLILIGGGSGVTPFRAYVEALDRLEGAPETVLFESARNSERLLFKAEFEAWAEADPWLTYEPVVTGEEANWAGRRGRLTQEALQERVTDPSRAIVFACGQSAFVDAVLEAAQAIGVPADRCRREGW